MPMKAGRKSLLLRLCGHLCSVGAPATATICEFPLWIRSGSRETVSGLALIMLILSAVPLFKALKDRLRSPSAFLIWLFIFLIVSSLRPIIDQLYVISLIGLISGTVSVVFYKLAQRAGGSVGVSEKAGGEHER